MTEQETFDKAMTKILTVSKEELQRRLEAEKKAKEHTRRTQIEPSRI